MVVLWSRLFCVVTISLKHLFHSVDSRWIKKTLNVSNIKISTFHFKLTLSWTLLVNGISHATQIKRSFCNCVHQTAIIQRKRVFYTIPCDSTLFQSKIDGGKSSYLSWKMWWMCFRRINVDSWNARRVLSKIKFKKKKK